MDVVVHERVTRKKNHYLFGNKKKVCIFAIENTWEMKNFWNTYYYFYFYFSQ
jgi:hypothetical protein